MYEAKSSVSRRQRFWTILPWALLALVIIVPLATLFHMAISAEDENVTVTRNEIVQEAGGTRGWHGRFTNRTGDVVYRDISSVILFLDKGGVPLGQARGGAAKLAPGESFAFQAPLPPGATRMQMYLLRWRDDRHSAVMGPYQPWDFGYLQWKCPDCKP